MGMSDHTGPDVISPRLVGFFFGMLLGPLFVAPAHAGDAPLPIETFFQKPKYGDAVLSPSGRYLAVVTPVNSRLNLGIIDLEARAVNAITAFNDADVFRVVWQNDDRLVVSWGDLHRGIEEPTRAYGIWAVDRDGRRPQRLDRGHATSGHILSGWQRPSSVQFLRPIPGTNDVLVTAYERSALGRDLYRVDTRTGTHTLLSFETPAPAAQWVVDFDNVPRAVVTNDLDHDKSAWYVRKGADTPWEKVEETGLGRLSSRPLQFSSDGKILYVGARRNSDRAAIYEYEIESAKWIGPVVQHADRDIVANPVLDLERRKLLGLRYQDDKPGVVWFEAAWATVQKGVDNALPDTVNFLQRASVGDRWIVVSRSDRNPGDVYLLDGKTLKMEKLFSYEPWIKPAEMASTQWVRYASRDGLTIPALLTIPADNTGKRIPLVVDIHGGPNVGATSWLYRNDVQFLASRGYAVLQPQFRGTNGFGWKFFSAGFRKWGDEMQDDLEDGVKWAVAEGIADPDRVCFFGASYGGYAAMWGAIKNAKLIKCAIAIAGVSSIDYMFDNAQTDISELAEKSTVMVELIGDPKTERVRFKRVNPLDNADQVGVPILLAYGAEDRRVPLVHGTDFRRALDRDGKPYEWVLYEHEGHGFSRDENLYDFYGRVERFLAKYLSANPAAAR
jgi:dipeptidyl aminopeptidase/acylaminoacyl peptidase